MWKRLLLAGWMLNLAFSCAANDTLLPELERSVNTSPRSIEAWDRYGMSLAHAHRFKEAEDALNHGLALAPKNNKILQHHLALVYAWSGNYNEATRRYNQLLQLHPKDSDIRIDYGQTLAWDKRYPESATQYKNVLSSQPQNVEALRHLGILEAWQGRYDDALI